MAGNEVAGKEAASAEYSQHDYEISNHGTRTHDIDDKTLYVGG